MCIISLHDKNVFSSFLSSNYIETADHIYYVNKFLCFKY